MVSGFQKLVVRPQPFNTWNCWSKWSLETTESAKKKVKLNGFTLSVDLIYALKDDGQWKYLATAKYQFQVFFQSFQENALSKNKEGALND